MPSVCVTISKSSNTHRALRTILARGNTYNLLAHRTIIRDFLTLRAAELLRAGCERLVEVVLLATGSGVVVWVVHLSDLLGLRGAQRLIKAT